MKRQLPEAADNTDEWMTALAIDLADESARQRVEALQWELAQDLLASGHTVIIEWGVWSRSGRDEPTRCPTACRFGGACRHFSDRRCTPGRRANEESTQG